MQETVKVGMIGVGAVGERVLKSFLDHHRTQVAALCDVNEERLAEFAHKVPEADLYTDYLHMLNDETIKLVYLAVPPKYHSSIAIDILKSGKHILCEKPLANSIEESLKMKVLAERTGLVHAMNFPMAYSNEKLIIQQKVQAGEIGKLKRIEMNMHFTEWPRRWQQNAWISSREQGGFIREVTPHFIQLIHSLFGELKVIASFVEYPEDRESCETGFVARMELEGGIPVIFNGSSGIGQKEHLSMKLFGDEGTIDLVNWKDIILTKGDSDAESVKVEAKSELNLVAECVKAMDRSDGFVIDFKDGHQVQIVLESLLNS
ncbi:Gfo/Idh/MocA family protein [Bacillus sp. CRN 9]|uniref:Gfo/Idh/MocA family protein n=1 Tax=Cytobacillus horneckiae TaxID=549687 RepID=UPI0015628B37|nr:Gfo/Idh/MocA family oxidoreductase [Bacillus sp. CRN 9]